MIHPARRIKEKLRTIFRDPLPEGHQALLKKETGKYDDELMTEDQLNSTVDIKGCHTSYERYNRAFHGDQIRIAAGEGSEERVYSYRSHQTVIDDDASSNLEVKSPKGFLGTALGAQRDTIHVIAGDGDDTIKIDGNSESNGILLELGAGNKSVNIDTGASKDFVQLRLHNDNTAGLITVDLGGIEGNALSIDGRGRETPVYLHSKPETLPNRVDGELHLIATNWAVCRQTGGNVIKVE